MTEPKTYSEFWPFYLREHALRLNRRLHFIGTTVGLVMIFTALVTFKFKWIGIGVISAYTFAWAGHFIFEKNRPATFKYPAWSFFSDWKMWAFTLSGKLDAELKKYQII
jgi:hypothetical protein